MITATVSHEMRTPINAILTQISSLEMILEGQTDQLKIIKVIKNSATLLLYLVNDMLDVYMIKNGKFQKINEKFFLKNLMMEIYEMFSL
jgi:signal transduction histidine kinase